MIQNVQSVADADEWANGRRANGRAKALTHACALAARIRPRWRGIRKPTHRQKLSQNSRARSCPLMPAQHQTESELACPLMPAHARSCPLSISITQHLNYSASQLLSISIASRVLARARFASRRGPYLGATKEKERGRLLEKRKWSKSASLLGFFFCQNYT